MSRIISPCCGQPTQACSCNRGPRVTVGPTQFPIDGVQPVENDIHIIENGDAKVFDDERGWVMLSTRGFNFRGEVSTRANLPYGASPGDVYITTDTHRAWIADGNNNWSGLNLGGTPGPAGASIWPVQGAAAGIDPASGEEGDWCFDIGTYVLYGPKRGGSWPTTGYSLLGATGPTGPKGEGLQISGHVVDLAAAQALPGPHQQGEIHLTDDGHMLVYDGHQFQDAGSIRGATGPMGPTGAVGQTGAIGAQGPPPTILAPGPGVEVTGGGTGFAPSASAGPAAWTQQQVTTWASSVKPGDLILIDTKMWQASSQYPVNAPSSPALVEVMQAPVGPQGIQGNVGPIGPQGPTGPVGPTATFRVGDGTGGSTAGHVYATLNTSAIGAGFAGHMATGTDLTSGWVDIGDAHARVNSGPTLPTSPAVNGDLYLTTGDNHLHVADSGAQGGWRDIAALPNFGKGDALKYLRMNAGGTAAEWVTGPAPANSDPLGPAGAAGARGADTGHFALDDHQHPSELGNIAGAALGTAAAGGATSAARSDHVHPSELGNVAGTALGPAGAAGTANTAARSDHVHPTNLPSLAGTTAGQVLSVGTGATGTVWVNPTPKPTVTATATKGQTPQTNPPAGTPHAGDVFINTGDMKTWVFDGTNWQSVACSPPTLPQVVVANAPNANPGAPGAAAMPAGANLVEGSIFLNTADHKVWFYDGAGWHELGNPDVRVPQQYKSTTPGEDPAAASGPGGLLDGVTPAVGDLFVNPATYMYWIYDGDTWTHVITGE